MAKLIQYSFFGRSVYKLTKCRRFRYAEELPGFIVSEQITKALSGAEFGGLQEGMIYIDWDDGNDPDHPKNWTIGTKGIILLEICLLTLGVYMASAIYTPGIEQIKEEFRVGNAIAMLPLSLFVIMYGIGPMILSPLSESVAIGRMVVYISTLLCFVALQVPVALASNLPGLLICRALSGLFASPVLATGGATISDIFSIDQLPAGLALWSLACVAGPVFGPLIGAVFVQTLTWRWSFWFMLLLSGVALFILILFFPETNPETLLYWRAQRLQQLTGYRGITTRAKHREDTMSLLERTRDILVRPFEIIALEPIVLFLDVYTGLMYAIEYLWFEAFPIVFQELYGFTLIQVGVSYCGIYVGVVLGAATYLPMMSFLLQHFKKSPENFPEIYLLPAIFGSVFLPTGVFIFGFCSTEGVHWIVPIIGTLIFSYGSFFLYESIFNYLGTSFQRYAASVFAGNGLMRATFAAAFPIFAYSLYRNLATERFPVGWGCGIVGFLTLAMMMIPVILYIYGPQLRARSKYAC
ncbi:major facilitator superfamily domain-containing protein [Dipodascopsis tothii]|uniref:major facilitator superfamily domain-containing protein n=1 Tax=Dipodascopsis tothii TaxID=44089 RepID=UPI0034CE4AAB